MDTLTTWYILYVNLFTTFNNVACDVTLEKYYKGVYDQRVDPSGLNV